MKQVWKFELKGLEEQAMMMPKGAVIISAKAEFDVPVIYAIVDANEKEMEAKSVKVFATRQAIDVNMTSWQYLDTVLTHYGNVVWHIFYK